MQFRGDSALGRLPLDMSLYQKELEETKKFQPEISEKTFSLNITMAEILDTEIYQYEMK